VAVKRSYNRYFIIFQEEDKGFGMAIDKQPTGYTKIETRNGRCKITSYVQNLVKDRGPYVCCLIDSTKNPPVMARLGEVKVDDTGRGETWWEFREDDIAETGIPYDRFNVSAIIVEGDRIYSPLAGYMGKERISWKDRIAYAPRSKVEETENEELKEEELNEEAKKFKAYEESIKPEENKKPLKGDNALNKEEAKGKETPKPNANTEKKAEAKAQTSSEKPKEGAGSKVGEGEKSKDNQGAKGAAVEKPKEGAGAKGGEGEKSKDGQGAKGAAAEKPKEGAGTKAASGEKPKDGGTAKGAGTEKSKDSPNSAVKPDDKSEQGFKPYAGYKEVMSPQDGITDDDLLRQPKKEGKYAGMFHNLLNRYEEIDNINDESKGTRWWRIPYSDDEYMDEDTNYPYNGAIHHLKMTYPYINYVKYFRQRGYYYFGMRYDDEGEVKNIMYGIEGMSTPKEQPYMGMTGFIKWQKMKDRDTGIWVMYYNPYTGCVMIPKKR